MSKQAIKLKTLAELARLKPVTPVANFQPKPVYQDDQPAVGEMPRDYGVYKDGRAGWL